MVLLKILLLLFVALAITVAALQKWAPREPSQKIDAMSRWVLPLVALLLLLQLGFHWLGP